MRRNVNNTCFILLIMKLKFYDQIPSTQITLSIRELVILQSLASKLITEDRIYEYALPTICNEEDSESIVVFAKVKRRTQHFG